MARTPFFASPAWLLIGLTRSSAIGQLVLRRNRLSFRVGDDVLFDVDRAEIERIVFPWYYFSGGMKVWAQRRLYRLSFVKPNSAEVATAQLLARAGSPAALGMVVAKVADMASGRRAGKRWRELLLTEPGGAAAEQSDGSASPS